MLNFELLWPEVGAYTTVKFVAAGLGDDLHHTARRLAVLGFVATRFYIDFLDEREIDAGSERQVISRENPNTAKSSIGDVDAIGHVLVFQPTASRNGGVGRTCPPTVVHSRSPIDQAADIASNWQLGIKGIGYRTRLKRDGKRRGSVGEHFDLFYIHSFEAGLLGLQRVKAGYQEVEH